MSFFGPPRTPAYYNSNNKMHGVVKPQASGTSGKAGTTAKGSKVRKSETDKSETGGEAVDDKAGQQEEEKKEEETETQINTRLNALLYHTSDDTIDLYKQQNNTSDLLGRLYYDDFDSDSVLSDGGSAQLTPVNSVPGSVADYFSAARHTNASINELISGAETESASASASASTAAAGAAATAAEGSNSNLNSRDSTPSFVIGSRSPSASASRIRPAVQRLASFERGISFDNLLDDHRRSLTFKVRHPQFKFRRNNKTYLTGFNGDIESIKSIEWLFDEMIVNGDTIIVLQVLDEKSYLSIDKSRAKESLRRIELLNKHVKKVSLVFEVVVGKPLKLLQSAIDEYNPQMMAIGTHNYEDREGKLHEHHAHKSFLSKSSMSKHFLECALVPVIVVKPFYEHVEMLKKPIDSENYFANWIADSDIKWTYDKDKNARRKRLTSPLASKNNSSTNLVAVESRGRRSNNNSHSNLPFLAQERANEGADALRAVKSHTHERRSRADEMHDAKSENPLISAVRSTESRSRSSSRTRTGLRKIFGHHH